jgi:cobalt-zinc-cadmium efflux system outer membrane protein
MIQRAITLLSTVLLMAGTAVAQSPVAQPPLTLDQCLAIALEQNPLLGRARDGHQAALARIEQSRAIPQPVVSYDSDLQPRPFQFGASGESYLGVTQTFEYPGRRSARRQAAAADAGVVLADLEATRLDLAYQVTEAFYRLLFAEERLGLAEEDRRLSDDFLTQTRLRHDTGDVAQVEVLRAQVEVARSVTAVRQARNEVDLGKASLAYVLGRPGDRTLAVIGTLQATPVAEALDALLDRALASRPELKGARAALDRERFREEQARQTNVPDLEVGLAHHRIAREISTWDVTFTVPVPLFFWQARRGEIAEARANVSAAAHEAERLRQGVLNEVEQAYRNAVAAHDQARHLETEVLAKASESYEMFAFAYKEGEIEGLELIAARRTLLEARQFHAEAVFTSSVAVAALKRAVGQ